MALVRRLIGLPPAADHRAVFRRFAEGLERMLARPAAEPAVRIRRIGT